MAVQSMAHHMPDFAGKLIDDGHFELVRLLGAGGCGVVYLAVDHQASTSSGAAPVQRAIKIVRKLEPPSLDSQKREVALHHLVSDIPHVLPLHDAWEDEQYIYIVLEHCESDMYKAMFERRVYCGNDERVRSVFLQILDAVHGCHKRRVFHRDLKPENILCNADGTEVYVADFGLATVNSRSTTFGCGSAPYLSPESVGQEFSHRAYSTERSDVWALGIILVNLITGLCPWEKAVTEDPSFCEYLLDDSYLERALPTSRGVTQILKKLFRINPRSRPNLEQLRKSILSVDTFFPPRKEPVCRMSPVPDGAVLSLALKRGATEVEEEIAAEMGDDTSDPGPYYGSEATSADESGPATPSSLPGPLDGSEFVEELDKALLPLAGADVPMKQVPQLNVLERLDLLALQ